MGTVLSVKGTSLELHRYFGNKVHLYRERIGLLCGEPDERIVPMGTDEVALAVVCKRCLAAASTSWYNLIAADTNILGETVDWHTLSAQEREAHDTFYFVQQGNKVTVRELLLAKAQRADRRRTPQERADHAHALELCTLANLAGEAVDTPDFKEHPTPRMLQLARRSRKLSNYKYALQQAHYRLLEKARYQALLDSWKNS